MYAEDAQRDVWPATACWIAKAALLCITVMNLCVSNSVLSPPSRAWTPARDAVWGVILALQDKSALRAIRPSFSRKILPADALNRFSTELQGPARPVYQVITKKAIHASSATPIAGSVKAEASQTASLASLSAETIKTSLFRECVCVGVGTAMKEKASAR